MEKNRMHYEPIIGLEIHAQLLTHSKAYSPDQSEYGALPNTRLHPISLGMPGTLPKVNQKVIEFALRMGLACQCEITPYQIYARKNYFYPDLPKGYQITQDKTPICRGGFIEINTNNGKKKIPLERIHMEEDAGKSIHDLDPHATLVDLNRAGVPLIEIVSSPAIASAQEASEYLQQMRKLLRYLEICDGNMEEGSLRCDVNISVRKKGETTFRERVEVKNLNSFKNVMQAIEFEFERQVDIYEKGGQIQKETRGFNALKGSTYSQRNKEGAADYRYFPEPDLPPIVLTKDFIAKIKNQLPILPDELYTIYTEKYKLSDYDAQVLIEDKAISNYYDKLIGLYPSYKIAANWLLGSIKEYLNKTATSIASFPIGIEKIAELIQKIDQNTISQHIAKQIFSHLLAEPQKNIDTIISENQLVQTTDDLEPMIQKIIADYPDKVAAYQNGKKGLLGFFVGELMRQTAGKADPKTVNQKILEALEK